MHAQITERRQQKKIPQQLGIIQPSVWIEAFSGGDLVSPQSNPDEVLILKIHTLHIQQQTLFLMVPYTF